MDKSIKLFKYQFKTSLKSIGSYYVIFAMVISILCFIAIREGASSGNNTFRSSGLELSTAIFIFVLALNFFRPAFFFSQANNISRKSFIKGSVLAGVAISAILPIIDIAINRIYNLFVNCGMNFDMLYGEYIPLIDEYGMTGSNIVVVNNDPLYLIKNYLFLVSVFVFVFALGFIITTAYYRLSKVGQVILSVAPIAAVILIGNLTEYIPSGLITFIENAFGLNTNNPLMAVMTFCILSIAMFAGQYLIARKSEATK